MVSTMKEKTKYWYELDSLQFLVILFKNNEAEHGQMVMNLAIDLDNGIIPEKFKHAIKGPYRVKKYMRPCVDVWKVIKARILKRDDYTCAYCGVRGGRLEVDHILPISRGGEHDDENLTASCMTCNRQKSNKTVEEWRCKSV